MTATKMDMKEKPFYLKDDQIEWVKSILVFNVDVFIYIL